MQANVDTRVSSSRRLQLKVCDDRRVRLRVGPSWGREPPPYNERGLKAQRWQALTLLGTHPVVEIWLMALTLYCTTPQLGFSLCLRWVSLAREAACCRCSFATERLRRRSLPLGRRGSSSFGGVVVFHCLILIKAQAFRLTDCFLFDINTAVGRVCV